MSGSAHLALHNPPWGIPPRKINSLPQKLPAAAAAANPQRRLPYRLKEESPIEPQSQSRHFIASLPPSSVLTPRSIPWVLNPETKIVRAVWKLPAQVAPSIFSPQDQYCGFSMYPETKLCPAEPFGSCLSKPPLQFFFHWQTTLPVCSQPHDQTCKIERNLVRAV
jgi:hypothetical protein